VETSEQRQARLDAKQPLDLIFLVGKLFANKERLIYYLQHFNVLAKDWVCPDHHTKCQLVKYESIDGYRWACKQPYCKRTKTIRYNSFCSQSHLELSNHCFFIPVKRRNKRTLWPLIFKHIAQGTKIISDGWSAYKGLDQFYEHEMVNHSENFKDPITGARTNTIEGCWFHFI
jgi:hypothetical protein